MDTTEKKFGVAFSGGGIRSAAFCSGVLRRLITQNAEPDYLSCVSGGGYTGSAFVQWKYSKNRQKDEGNWRNDFFDHMRKRSGYICNWNKGFGQGCWDAFVLGCLLFFVAIVIPVVGWSSFACPIAFLVKLFYGKYVDGKICRKSADGHDCKERTGIFVVSISIFLAFHFLEYLLKRCNLEKKENYQTVKWIKILLRLVQLISGASFAFTFLPWFIKDFLQYTHLGYRIAIVVVSALFWFFVPVLRRYSALVIFVYLYSYAVFWHVYDETLLNVKHTEERFRIALGISLIILGFASVVGDFHLHLVHIYWRWRLQKAFYYRGKNENSCSGIECYDIFPGCYCEPTTSAGDSSLNTTTENGKMKYLPLTLDDCKEVKKPVYISSMVVDDWRRKYKESVSCLTMSPKGIAVLGHHREQATQKTNKSSTGCDIEMSTSGQGDSREIHDRSSSGRDVALTSSVITIQPDDSWLNDEEIGEKLTSNDIKLSSAMAMSSAAVSPYSIAMEEQKHPLIHILTVFGFDMAATIVYDMKAERRGRCCPRISPDDEVKPPNNANKCEKSEICSCGPGGKICCFFLNSMIFLAFVLCGLIFFCIDSPSSLTLPEPVPVLSFTAGIIIIVCLVLLWILLTSILSCDCAPCCVFRRCTEKMEKSLTRCSRWSTVHLPIYRFIRYILNIITVGPDLPALLHLSDGGLYENYGLLPLLELKLPKILIADGSHIESDEGYAKEIIHAMELARDLLGCSFTAMDGGDVLTDMKENYVNGERPRMYEFKVQYYERGPEMEEKCQRKKCGEGTIILLAPRHPAKEPESMEMKTWDDYEEDLKESEWGDGPYLTEKDVNRIDGCPGGLGCCECCQVDCCCSFKGCCSSSLAFPRHSTANQFFTPKMFATYHREGYRACIECDEFLAG